MDSSLRWLGHVLRMGPERLPRRMLSPWVAHKRPAGAPQFTYGRTIAKAMDVFDLDPSSPRTEGRCIVLYAV